MALAELLAVANTAANSADIVVTTPIVVGLKTALGGALPAGIAVSVSMKDDGGHYNNVGSLSGRVAQMILNGPATYRISRAASRTSVGVFQGG